jgi:hypothetical protein
MITTSGSEYHIRHPNMHVLDLCPNSQNPLLFLEIGLTTYEWGVETPSERPLQGGRHRLYVSISLTPERTYLIHVDMSRTPEQGAHSPSWPNRLIIIIVIK